MNIQNFTILPSESIYTALEKIDENKKGFLIVTDINYGVLGTVTDGDIRRGLIKGVTIRDSLEKVIEQDYTYIKIDASFDELIEKFKSPKVNFLPILDYDDKLSNLITKKQFHFLLVEDIVFDLNFNFLSLDEHYLEHEIFNRPWGFYKTTFLNPYSRAKVIKVYPLEELSLQEHKKREEHWVIIKGYGELVLGESVKNVRAGDYIYIPKGCKHKISNTSPDESLMISEVQLGDYFGEDDIIRYKDKYGRV